MLKHCGRQNNIEITDIPNTIQDELENKVIEISMLLVLKQNQLILNIVIELKSPKITLKKL